MKGICKRCEKEATKGVSINGKLLLCSSCLVELCEQKASRNQKSGNATFSDAFSSGKMAHPESLITHYGACGQDVIIRRLPLCECGHAREEHFREDGDCMHKYDDDNRCDCEDYMPKKEKKKVRA